MKNLLRPFTALVLVFGVGYAGTSNAQSSAHHTEGEFEIGSEDMLLLKNLFEQGRLLKNMNCEIHTHWHPALKKFKQNSEWIDALEISYSANRFSSGQEEKITLTQGLKMNTKKVQNLRLGRIEEFRIEIGDDKDSFIEFSHDGEGHITGFLFGDIHRLYPCQQR